MNLFRYKKVEEKPIEYDKYIVAKHNYEEFGIENDYLNS